MGFPAWARQSLYSAYSLKTRYEPSDAAVDIIAVQGLWADPERTWRRHGVLWLSDLLPLDIPSARISSFGPTKTEQPVGVLFSSLSAAVASASVVLGFLGAWKLQWRAFALPGAVGVGLVSLCLYLRKYLYRLQSTPLTAIHDCATQLLQSLVSHQKTNGVKPIIFIGHSFGGLVVKEAVFLATQDATYSSVLESAKGFLFLGTPHAGSRLASASQRWWLNTIPDIRVQLSVGSGYLAGLDNRFRAVEQVKACRNMYCFYETREMHYGPSFLPTHMIVVDKRSATWPDQPEIPAIALDRNHSQLSKYSSRDDADYKKVVAALQAATSSSTVWASAPGGSN